MINLIPATAKKKVSREYWMRVSVVWIFLLSLAFVIIGVLQFPSYILLNSQLSAYNSQFQTAQSQQLDFKKSEEAIVDTNKLAKHLTVVDEAVLFSDYFSALEKVSGGGVEISRYMFSRGKEGFDLIKVSGVANTRSALTQFSAAVAEHDLFSEANVPISNLAKDRDIAFEIDVMVNKE